MREISDRETKPEILIKNKQNYPLYPYEPEMDIAM